MYKWNGRRNIVREYVFVGPVQKDQPNAVDVNAEKIKYLPLILKTG